MLKICKKGLRQKVLSQSLIPINGVQSSDPRVLAQKRQNMRNWRFPFVLSNTQDKTLIPQPLIYGVPEVASSKNKLRFHRNLRKQFS